MASKTWTIICNADDEAYVASLAARYPLVSRHKLTQLALRYGLRACQQCPELLVAEASRDLDAAR